MTGIEGVFREHRLGLLRLAFLLSGAHEASEDAVQSAFASAQVHWDRIDDPLAYLRRSVINQVKDGQRRAFRWRSKPVPPAPEAILPPDVDETWTVVSGLPRHQRAVLVLHYYADLPLVQIADLVGRPPATVRSDHRRALDTLRKALS